VRFDGPMVHLELLGNLGVRATLQQQLNDLLFAWSQKIRAFTHLFTLPINARDD